ncbi:MAG: hypothetical protein CMD72_00545 [Gammaproteobacteria bacterium]|nr:hypothetical protein [Gammaproteobacteria bacterium]
MINRYKLDYKVNPEFDCVKYVKSYNEKNFTIHNYSDKIIRADFCNSLISIIFNTNNLENTKKILNKFSEKTKNTKNIQFCIKIDNDINKFTEKFLNSLKDYNFNFVILSSGKGRGFIDLWQWVNYLFKVSSKNSKFIMNISDEMYIKEYNWDETLEKYIHYFEDNIFRLRTSVYKNRNYIDLYECGYAPDTTAIYSRKYLEIQEDFSPCFGPDNGQQFVAFYLSKINLPRHYQFSRDIVINGISFLGQGTNAGLTDLQKNKRANINFLMWKHMFRYKNQNNYFQRARKIQISILKEKYKKLKIENNYYVYKLTFKNENNTVKNLYLKNYLSKLNLLIYNLSRFNFIKYNTGYHSNFFKGCFVSLYFLIYNKFPIAKKVNNNDSFVKKFSEVINKLNKIINKFNKFLNKYKLNKLKNFNFGLTNIFNFIFFYLKIIILTFFFIFYHLIYPKKIFGTIVFIFRKIFLFKKVNSNIFTNDVIDQSNTLIVKGD